jgi:hypothetical protein
MYNGIGYAAKGVPSPYLWAGTDQYKSGKYIADGVYNAAVVDQQLGCVAMLFSMMAIDPTITFTGAKVKPAESDVPKTGTNVPNPAQSSGWAAFFSAILSIFIKRK